MSIVKTFYFVHWYKATAKMLYYHYYYHFYIVRNNNIFPGTDSVQIQVWGASSSSL